MRIYLEHSKAFELATDFPGDVGMFFGITTTRKRHELPAVQDNGRFPVWSSGKEWDQQRFLDVLARNASAGLEWVVVPDVVGSAVQTMQWWLDWVPRLESLGVPLALAVQDGMTAGDVLALDRQPDVIFVGGSTVWKRRTIWHWCTAFPRVHVGRVNTEKWLWNAKRCGAESVDGTGWFRGGYRSPQAKGLHRFLTRQRLGLGTGQLELGFSEL